MIIPNELKESVKRTVKNPVSSLRRLIRKEDYDFPSQSRAIIGELYKAGRTSPNYRESQRIFLDANRVVENRCIGILPNASELEAYKVLRTQIQHRMKEKGGNTVMFTSALPQEGKTLTAINLSLTIAKDFHETVMLVDCDFRKQNIHRYLGLPGGKGLVDYFLNGEPLEHLIIWPSIEKFTFISGEQTLWESPELLGSPKMKELVEEMSKRYPDRYVFFDLPPVLTGADALAFAPLVDFIVVVVKAGAASAADITRALDLLPREKILGIVLNGQQPDSASLTAQQYYRPGMPAA